MFARRFCLAILLSLAFSLLRIAPLQAKSATVQLWLVNYKDQDDLNHLAADLDVWEVDHATQQLLAPLTAAEVDALSQSHTLTLAPDQSPLDPPQISILQTDGIPGFACYRTVDESLATMDKLAKDYPDLVKKLDIGDSWDKATSGGSSGDDMRVLALTNKKIPGPKFHFMLMGAIHAREYVTAELALRFAELLLHTYGSDADVTGLLDHGELDLLTYANPDGRRIAETGELWRKNTHLNPDLPACTISLPGLSYGVDLNRNSSFMWNGCDGFSCSSANNCTETYRGTAPGTEPEVGSIQAFLRSIFPGQRGEPLDDSAPEEKPGLFLSLHSYGELVLFPWGFTANHAPNALGLATIARHFGYPLNYTVCQAGGDGCLYQTDGTTDDFAYGALGVPSFTIEFGNAFFQSCTTFEESMVQPAMDAFLYAFNAAPRAYFLSKGPEVVEMAVVSKQNGSQNRLVISATADATRIAPLSGIDVESITEPTEPIQSARMTVDQLPWNPAPVVYPLFAADGAFNGNREAITTTLEISCFPSGRHTLYLQAEDTGDDWGVVAADFVTVTNASPFQATIHTDQATVHDGDSITYTIALTNTAATTATYAVETHIAAATVISPSNPITVRAGHATQVYVTVMPQKNTAGAILPAVVVIRSTDNPAQCRQVQTATPIVGVAYHLILSYIKQN